MRKMVTIVPVIPKRILVHKGHLCLRPCTKETMESTRHGAKTKTSAHMMIMNTNRATHASKNIPKNAIYLPREKKNSASCYTK